MGTEEIITLIVFGTLIVLAFYFWLLYIVAKHFEKIAFDKGYDGTSHAFAMCFWLGIVGYIYVAAMPMLKEKSEDVISNKEIDSTSFQNETNALNETDNIDQTDPEKEKLYEAAKIKMQRGSGYNNARFYKEAIEIFTSIADYKDSSKLIETCKEKIKSLDK